MVAWAGAGKDPRSLLEGKLHRKSADTAAGTCDEQCFPVQARQLGQCLPSGEAGTGQGCGGLVTQGIGHRQQGAGWYPGVAGKAAVVAQVGVIGDPGTEAQMADVGAEGHDSAHAINAGHLTVLPVGVAIFDQLPVHRIEGDDPVCHQHLVRGERCQGQIGEGKLGRFTGGMPAPGLGVIHDDSL